MAKPKDENAKEVRYWLIRHIFGGLTATAIKSPNITVEELEILQEFIDDVIMEKLIETR